MKFIFCMQISIGVFCKVILSFWVSATRHAQSTHNNFAYLCNISIKAWEMKLIFCLQINSKVDNKMIVSLWVCVSRQAQSSKNNQFKRSLQNLKENMKDEVFFAYWWMLKLFSNWYYHFRCLRAGMPKLSKIISLLFLYSMLRKKWVMQLIFYMQVSMRAC